MSQPVSNTPDTHENDPATTDTFDTSDTMQHQERHTCDLGSTI